ncbi:phospho-2-dehydro-3-deoxyheptonate aldolase 2, chloroplastic-like protein, partial [Tanacetum coccineum]
SVLKILESYPPIVFAGECRKLEERLGEAARGDAFLLQGGDCAESFKEFKTDNIRDTFRLLLQMSVVLMFGGQMPVIKLGHAINMLPVVSLDCTFSPHFCESPGSLPVGKLSLHFPSLTRTISATLLFYFCSTLVPVREGKCNESFPTGRLPALSQK